MLLKYFYPGGSYSKTLFSNQSNKFKFKNMEMHNSFFGHDEKEKWIPLVKERI